MIDSEIYIQRSRDTQPLRDPLLRSIIQSLELPPGSHGLDAGCGIGLPTLLLAEAVESQGHITGIDILPELLAYGENIVRQARLSERITFQQGNVSCLPFGENTFDWVWSADCIGYPAGELIAILAELIRVVKPGGSVILLGWSSQQLLPGYPLLEARLNATCSSYIPFLQEQSPDLNFARSMKWFRYAGLEDVEAQTFVRDIRGPLSADERVGLISLFDMLWEEPQSEDAAEDWQEYQRLCKPESADFILDLPDYFGFFTFSVFRGNVPKASYY